MEKKNSKCIFTEYSASEQNYPSIDRFEFQSDACGRYFVTYGAISKLREFKAQNRNKLTQGHINCARKTIELEAEDPTTTAVWCTRDESEILKKKFTEAALRSGYSRLTAICLEDFLTEHVDHGGKAIKLLNILSSSLGAQSAYSEFYLSPKDQISAGICDLAELGIIIDSLTSDGLISELKAPNNPINNPSGLSHTIFDFTYQLTVRGWKELNRSIGPNSNKVFIATAFHWPESDEIRTQAIDVIKKVCKDLGFEASTVSQAHTDNISNRILAEIKNCAFMVAELTYHNRGVYFESGFARGLGKLVFHVVHEDFTSADPKDDINGKRIHFDIQQVMYRKWKTPTDLEQNLRDWIEASVGRANKK